MPPTSRGLILPLARHASRAFLRSSLSQDGRLLSGPGRSVSLPARPPVSLANVKPVPDAKLNAGKAIPRDKQEPADTPQLQSTPRHSSARWWVWAFFVLAPTIAVVGMSWPLTINYVHGGSMAPTLNGDPDPDLPEMVETVLVRKVRSLESPFGPFKDHKFQLERGQIVVYYAPHNPAAMSVKRVVGLPGDRVTPWPGYPGGDEPVVVPYNHIWVEGDANSRKKSVDSNTFGPISQNLVFGVVLASLTPLFSPKVVNWREHDYPAKKSGRVEMDVVHDAKLDPDRQQIAAEGGAFGNGVAARELALMKKNPDQLPALMRDPKKFSKLRNMYQEAREELRKQNPQSGEVARGLIEELERAFETAGLHKDGSPLAPSMRKTEDSGDPEAAAEQESKQRKLREYLERQQQQQRSDPVQVKNDGPRMSFG